jgi:heme exporter protein CcmD
MEPSEHLGFIVAAYIVAVIVVAGLSLWVIGSYRQLKARLDMLEAQGISRRSGAKLS